MLTKISISMLIIPTMLLSFVVKAEPTVITFTQVPCQFLEVEPVNHQFTSSRSKDCEKINKKTGEDRLAVAKTLRLKPGEYIFRVTNKSVSYGLGFYLRPASVLDRLSLPDVSGGGLSTGVTKDYKISLIPGEYVFSCPLNPTPDYPLIVSN